MGTKMKGILKGLRYISQIFDTEEEKEPEMQIGHPTDVKHVAHIGRDGPSIDSPSWMQEFKSPAGSQSAPLGAPIDSQGNPEIKWVSEDSSRRGRRTKNSPARDLPELPKSSRRHSSTDNSLTTESSSTKSRQSRRHQSKDSSEIIKTTGVPLDANLEPESPSRNLPDIPKKSRRKKSKESNSGGSLRSRRSKGTTSCTYTSQLSDPGPEIGTIVRSNSNELFQSSSLKPLGQEDQEKASSGIS